jgi:hypothetical protein
MTKDEQQQALENIELIKEIVTRTKKEMSYYRGGWVCFVWGIFCFLGMAGQRLFIPEGWAMGAWWFGLSLIAGTATYLIVKKSIRTPSQKEHRELKRMFLVFWGPLILLAYTLCLFCVFLPGLSEKYITVFILLVVSTGYIMLGLAFFKEILYMGVIGMVSSILCAVFFLDHSDIILSGIFGIGLIITGLFINHKWKE